MLGAILIVAILSVSVWISWGHIYEILTFEDLNKNCIHDEEEAKRLARVENIIGKENQLANLISQV